MRLLFIIAFLALLFLLPTPLLSQSAPGAYPGSSANTWTAPQTFNAAVTFANTISTTGGFTGNTLFIEGSAPTGSAGNDSCGGNSTTHVLQCNFNNGTTFAMTQTIGSGTATMTTAAITAGACGTTVTVSAANVATTDTITWAFNAAPAGTNAGIVAWPTSGNVNFAYCPGVAETPASATINWRVVR